MIMPGLRFIVQGISIRDVMRMLGSGLKVQGPWTKDFTSMLGLRLTGLWISDE